MKSYRDLIVWEKSMLLVTDVYQLSKNFPHEETYGLTNQMRRSAVSVPSNIAEGYGRNHSKEISRGSLYELQTQLEIDFNAISNKSLEIEKMLNSLISKIKNSDRDR